MTKLEIIDAIRKAINERLLINVPISISETDFGMSAYIQVYGMGKIRISDHSVYNFDRVMNEEHYHFQNVMKVLDFLIRDVEILYFPERYERFEREEIDEKFSSDYFMSEAAFREKFRTAKIQKVEPFTNKAGVEKVKVYFSYEIRVKRSYLRKIQ